MKNPITKRADELQRGDQMVDWDGIRTVRQVYIHEGYVAIRYDYRGLTCDANVNPDTEYQVVPRENPSRVLSFSSKPQSQRKGFYD